MYKFIFSFLSFFLIIIFTASAQIATTSKKAAKYYKSAEEARHKRDFNTANQLLEKAIKADPNFFNAHYQLAANYHLFRRDNPTYAAKSEKHYRRAAEIQPNLAKVSYLYFIVAEFDMQKGDYEHAKMNYDKYLSFKPREKRSVAKAFKSSKDCAFALEGMKKPLDFKPEPLPKNVNRNTVQYYPVLSADQETMIFTSRRGTKPPMDHEDMFVSYKKDGNWSDPEPITEINTFLNEGTCTISADGKTLIFTFCRGTAKRRVIAGSCDLFISYNEGGQWSNPINMGGKINSQYWDTQPSLSADGNTLYFVSSRPGGKGGIDIWMSEKDENDEWKVPVNLGTSVNTPFDEVAPFIHANNKTLYFASDGHIGYGGRDLYKIEKENNTWGKAENLGYPINDFTNQVGLFVTADGKTGYYSHEKVRDGALVSSILHSFELPEEIRVKTASNYLKGTVYNAKTKEKLGAKIDLYNLKTDSLVSQFHSDAKNGSYLITLNKGSDYALNVNKEGYLFQSKSFDYTEVSENLVIDIYLDPIAKDQAVELNNIFFETAKWDLKEKSKTELNILIKFLKENPKLTIEIGGHTDDVGSTGNNQKLSEQRAKSVSSFLTEQGIDKSRLKSVGYGESEPKVNNDSDQNRQANRRIEFKIL
jgi:outer membrane protein OmpA-like peptidoglycan-associated protein